MARRRGIQFQLLFLFQQTPKLQLWPNNNPKKCKNLIERGMCVCVGWGAAGAGTWKIVKSCATPLCIPPPIPYELIALCGGGIHQTSIKLGSLRMPCHRAYNLRLCLGLAASWALFFFGVRVRRLRLQLLWVWGTRRHCLTAFSWYGFCFCWYCNLDIACLHIETFRRKGRARLFKP